MHLLRTITYIHFRYPNWWLRSAIFRKDALDWCL